MVMAKPTPTQLLKKSMDRTLLKDLEDANCRHLGASNALDATRAKLQTTEVELENTKDRLRRVLDVFEATLQIAKKV
jgi:hypothetical protein